MYFSVIVTVYRVEQYIKKCIDSILGQTFGDFELILVDDGSPDGCPAICDGYAARDARVRVIHKANGGPTAARKTGIEAARGEYVVNVDGDDWLPPNALENIHDIAESSRADAVITAKRYEYPNRSKTVTEILHEGLYRGEAKDALRPYIIMNERMEHLEYQQIGAAVRRSVFLPCQMSIDDGLRLGEDMLCMTRVYMAAGSVYISRVPTYHYLVREGSLSDGFGDAIFDNLTALIRVLRASDGEGLDGYAERVDRYIAFTCFILLERAARAKAWGELHRLKMRMAEPPIREGIERSRFCGIKPKRRVCLALMRRGSLRAAYVFLRACGAVKAALHAVTS